MDIPPQTMGIARKRLGIIKHKSGFRGANYWGAEDGFQGLWRPKAEQREKDRGEWP